METSNRTYLAFAGAVVIGGTNFIAVSFSNQELPPFFGAALRFALAAFLFIILSRLLRVPWPRGRAAAGAALYGLFGFGVSYAMLYYALLGLAAGTASVIMASVPLFTLLIAVLIGQERFSLRRLAGGMLAIAGIGVLSLGTLGGGLGVSYLVAAILGAATAAASSVVAKGLPKVHPVNMNAVGMASGALLLGIGSLIFREPWGLPLETQTWLALIWLVLLGSVGLFQLFLYVIKRLTASATVYAITAMPVVAVLLGALLLDQPITLEVVAGGALVVLAVYVGAIRRPRSQATTPSRGREATIGEA